MSNSNSNNPSLLQAFYGSKSFLKIYQALEIDKIRFSFANIGDERNSIDIYISVEEFHADLISKYKRGVLENRRQNEIERARKNNDQYCKDIWVSRGGKTKKGNFRCFTIQPGKNTTYVFRASESGGKGQSTPKNVIVGVSDKDLITLDFRWGFLYEDYKKVLAERYSLKNMKSSFSTSREESIDYEESNEPENVSQQPAGRPVSSPQRYNGENKPKPSPGGNNAISSRTTPVAQGGNSSQQIGGNQTETPKGEVKSFKLKVSTPIIRLRSSNYALEGYTEDNMKFSVIFPRNLLDENDPFYNVCSNAGKMIVFRGIAQNNRIYATSLK